MIKRDINQFVKIKLQRNIRYFDKQENNICVYTCEANLSIFITSLITKIIDIII